jgi:steroid delta-isomerase
MRWEKRDDLPCKAYRTFMETLTLESIDQLDRLAAPEIHFHDPFYDVHGIPAVKDVFRRMFKEVEQPVFYVTDCACTGRVCFLRWHFTCRPRVFSKGHPWVVDGVTELVYDELGRVVEHADYWDAGHYVYERIPGVNVLIRLVKRRIIK